MNLSEQEMGTLFSLISRANHDQLIKANQQIRATLDVRSRQATNSLRVGAKVKWNGKQGPKTGTVLRIKQKYVEVKEDILPGTHGFGITWNVAASILSTI